MHDSIFYVYSRELILLFFLIYFDIIPSSLQTTTNGLGRFLILNKKLQASPNPTEYMSSTELLYFLQVLMYLYLLKTLYTQKALWKHWEVTNINNRELLEGLWLKKGYIFYSCLLLHGSACLTRHYSSWLKTRKGEKRERVKEFFFALSIGSLGFG